MSDDKLDSKNKATSEEAIAGTDDTKYTTPATVKSAIDKAIKETPPSSTKIIQEDGVATTDNVYSAVAVNNILKNREIDISYTNSSFTKINANAECILDKIVNISIIGHFTSVSQNADLDIGTIEAKYRPKSKKRFTIPLSGMEDIVLGEIGTDGIILIRNGNHFQIVPQQDFYINITYMI